MLASPPAHQRIGCVAVVGAALLASCTHTEELTDTGSPRAAAAVRTGAATLAEDLFARFRGLRLGLITNPTARVGHRHLIDLLVEAPEVELVVLFAPEHGLRGRGEAGDRIDSGVDAATGLPVVSLYGETRSPPAENLAGLDALVFDIQDVGARFYTYISTLGLSMQAASRAGLPFVVLDRPNPLGGVLVEGFVLEEEQRSFVGSYPIPIAHGLTVGELAQMIRGEGWLDGLEDLDLEVVRMTGWRRAMLWPGTGLEWQPTSPNVPTFATALAYPGTCLFEGTVWSEGRGTESPFLLIGGAGLEGEALVEAMPRLPGLELRAASFVPTSLPGYASRPKLEGEVLGGVRLEITGPEVFRPVASGVALLRAFLEVSGLGQEAFRAPSLDRLAGTERLREMLLAGAQAEEIARSWRAEVDAFQARRRPYLLYQ